MKFSIFTQSKKSQARTAFFSTAHGKVQTPCFMPIATRGAVKNLSMNEMHELGTQILLSNTYHLMLTPGLETVAKAGGFHALTGWNKPLLTDSGGYQVYSLAKMRKITDEGVSFQSHLDGSHRLLTPESVIEAQMQIGSDIMMVLDECAPGDAAYDEVQRALERTRNFAERSFEYFSKKKTKSKQAMFGIVQGGRFSRLRKLSAQQIGAIDFDGYAIGGVSVGEGREHVRKIIQYTAPLLPFDKPKYLMGMGRPEEIVFAVKNGVDMFDCVIPTREARHGKLYVFCNKKEKNAVKLFGNIFYRTITITNEQFKNDFSSVNVDASLKLVSQTSKAYLRHLLHTSEGLGFRIATLNNLDFYLRLMQEIRKGIEKGEV